MAKTLQTTVEIAGSMNASFQSAINSAEDGIASLGAAADGSGLDKLGDDMKEAADATGIAGEGFTVFKGILSNLGSQVISAAAGALKDFAGDIVNTGMEFSSMMSEVQALSGATGSEMATLTAAAREYGASTVFSATESAEALKYMALAGWDTEESVAALPGVLDLAAASGMELGKASDMVTDYLSAFSMEADQATYFADMLTVAQSTSNTTAEGLGEAYKNCAANLNAAGQDVETVTSLLMVMANQGDKGSEAGTKLKAVMRDISNSMEDGAIKIGDTSVSVEDANGNFRDLTDILADVEEATYGLGDADRTTALEASFTADSLSAVNEILNAGVGSAATYEESLRNSTGAASKAAATMTDNLSGDLTKFQSAVEGLGLTIYDYVDAPLRGVVQTATDIISGITKAITPQKTLMDSFIEDISAMNEEVGKSLENARTTVDDAYVDAEEMDYYKDIILEFNGATDRTQWQSYQLKNAVSQLSGVVPGLAEAWDDATGSLKLTNQEISSMIDRQRNLVIQQALLSASEEALTAQTEAALAKAMADSAVEDLEKEVQRLEKLNEKSLETNPDAGWGYGEYYTELLENQNDLDDAIKAQTAANEVYEEAEDAATEFTEAYDEAGEIMGYVAEASDDVTDAVGGASGSLEEFGDEAVSASEEAQAAFEEMRDSIATSISASVSAFSKFSGGDELSTGDALANLQSQYEGIQKWKENMITLGGAAGMGMTQEFYDYLADLGPGSANFVQSLVDSMNNNPEEFAAVAAQYTETMKLEDDTDIIASYTSAGVGIVDAVTEASGDVGDSLEEGAASGAARAADSIVSSFGDAMGEAYENAKAEISSLQNLFSSAEFKLGSKIQLPHFSMSGSFDAKTNETPSVSVEWYKEGGILDGATIFGMMDGELLGGGEAGPEAVLPLDSLWKNMGSFIDSALENQDSQTAVAGELLSMDDFSLSGLAGGGQSVVYDFSGTTYAPNIYVTGNADTDDIMTQLRRNEGDFFDWLERWAQAKGAALYA